MRRFRIINKRWGLMPIADSKVTGVYHQPCRIQSFFTPVNTNICCLIAIAAFIEGPDEAERLYGGGHQQFRNRPRKKGCSHDWDPSTFETHIPEK